MVCLSLVSSAFLYVLRVQRVPWAVKGIRGQKHPGSGGRKPRQRRTPQIVPSFTPVCEHAANAQGSLSVEVQGCLVSGTWGWLGGRQTALGMMCHSHGGAAFKLRPEGVRRADWGQCRGFGVLCPQAGGAVPARAETREIKWRFTGHVGTLS